MKIEFTYNSKVYFAQAYGSDAYGSQTYSGCVQTADGCVVPTSTTETPPNTGFLGMTPDAAVASLSGVLLVALAVVGTIFVVTKRIRSRKNKDQV
jgi:hypothetical protein